MRTLLVALVLCAIRATASACDPSDIPTHFELFDSADQVVVAIPTSVPKNEVGEVTLHVERALKGKQVKTLTTSLTGSTCDPRFPLGKQMIVFFFKGERIGLHFGPVVTGNQPWVALVEQWAASKDDRDRAAIAAAAIAAGGDLAPDGIFLLRRVPSIRDALTDDQIALITTGWPKLHSGLRGLLREVNHAKLRKALDAATRKQRRPK
jgi:hypothetical protein